MSSPRRGPPPGIQVNISDAQMLSTTVTSPTTTLPSTPTPTLGGNDVLQRNEGGGTMLTFTSSLETGSIQLTTPLGGPNNAPSMRSTATSAGHSECGTESDNLSLQSSFRLSSDVGHGPPPTVLIPFSDAIAQAAQVGVSNIANVLPPVRQASLINIVRDRVTADNVVSVLARVWPPPSNARAAAMGWRYFMSSIPIDRQLGTEDGDPEDTEEEVIAALVDSVASLVSRYWESTIHPAIIQRSTTSQPRTAPSSTHGIVSDNTPADSNPIEATLAPPSSASSDTSFGTSRTSIIRRQNHTGTPPLFSLPNQDIAGGVGSSLPALPQEVVNLGDTSQQGVPSARLLSSRGRPVGGPRSLGPRPFVPPPEWLSTPRGDEGKEDRQLVLKGLRNLELELVTPDVTLTDAGTSRTSTEQDVADMAQAADVAVGNLADIARGGTGGVRKRAKAEMRRLQDILRNAVHLPSRHSSRSPSPSPTAQTPTSAPAARGDDQGRNTDGTSNPSATYSQEAVTASPAPWEIPPRRTPAPPGPLQNIYPSASSGIMRIHQTTPPARAELSQTGSLGPETGPHAPTSASLSVPSPMSIRHPRSPSYPGDSAAEANEIQLMLDLLTTAGSGQSNLAMNPQHWVELYMRLIGLCSFIATGSADSGHAGTASSPLATPGASTSTSIPVRASVTCINPRHRDLGLPCATPIPIAFEIPLPDLLTQLERAQVTRISQLFSIVSTVFVNHQRDVQAATQSPPGTTDLDAGSASGSQAGSSSGVGTNQTGSAGSTPARNADPKGKGRQV